RAANDSHSHATAYSYIESPFADASPDSLHCEKIGGEGRGVLRAAARPAGPARSSVLEVRHHLAHEITEGADLPGIAPSLRIGEPVIGAIGSEEVEGLVEAPERDVV